MPEFDLCEAHPSIERDAGNEADIASRLRRHGFGFVRSAVMRQVFEKQGSAGWPEYARSWDDLAVDRFMADGGTYRKRRFACLAASGTSYRLKAPRPHVQTLEHNPLNGGVARIFAPVFDDIVFNAFNRAVVLACLDVFGRVNPVEVLAEAWHAEMHQFRIEARPDAVGLPTPEGLHRDGVDWVLAMLIRRENVAGGASTVADRNRRPALQVTLSEPMDTLLLDDRRVFHGVGPVVPLDPSRPAWRDVLVLTFRGEG